MKLTLTIDQTISSVMRDLELLPESARWFYHSLGTLAQGAVGQLRYTITIFFGYKMHSRSSNAKAQSTKVLL